MSRWCTGSAWSERWRVGTGLGARVRGIYGTERLKISHLEDQAVHAVRHAQHAPVRVGVSLRVGLGFAYSKPSQVRQIDFRVRERVTVGVVVPIPVKFRIGIRVSPSRLHGGVLSFR